MSIEFLSSPTDHSAQYQYVLDSLAIGSPLVGSEAEGM